MSSITDVSLSSYKEDQGFKVTRKAKEEPFVANERTNFVAIAANGLYKLKSR